MKEKDTRRDFLKKAALLTGGLSMPQVIPMSIQKAMAIQADPGTTFYDAEHVVFLMQENRSFDHLFGKLRGVRGFNNPRVKTLPNEKKAWLQDDEKGNTFGPFHTDIHQSRITWQGGLPHSWPDQIAARNGGKYDRWVPAKTVMSLAYYQREDVPFYYSLADAFTICDHHFCASLTGTTPNRLYFWTGTVRPEANANTVPVVNNSQAESRDQVFVDWKSFPETLEEEGVSWKVYQNEVWTAALKGETDDWLGNYGDNPLEYLKRHRVKLSAYFRANGDSTSRPPLTAEQVQAAYAQLSDKEKNLINKAFTTNIENPDYLSLESYTFTNDSGKEETIQLPKEDIFETFRKDVNEDRLPTVSWLVAPQRFSDHTSTPLYGTWYVSEALDILASRPEVWKKTIFILTYDENDGYFDHLAPFVPPHPQQGESGKVSPGLEAWLDYEYKRNSPIGLGYRVPLVVASPWSKGGYVNSEVCDLTSSLMFLEKWLSHRMKREIKCESISPWRRAMCGDLTSVFRPFQGEPMIHPKAPARNQVVESIHNARLKPLLNKPMPLEDSEIAKMNQFFPFEEGASSLAAVQEKGTRPACAIPYHLQVDAVQKGDRVGVIFECLNPGGNFHGKGAPFHVYTKTAYREVAGATWSYAVRAGDFLEDEWKISDFKEGKYQLTVDGPNGFFRRFEGDTNDRLLKVTCREGKKPFIQQSGTELVLTFENESRESLGVWLHQEVYEKSRKKMTLRAGQKIQIPISLKKYRGWYDFQIRIEGHSHFLRHYAGHIEDGRESISDPYMGGLLS